MFTPALSPSKPPASLKTAKVAKLGTGFCRDLPLSAPICVIRGRSPAAFAAAYGDLGGGSRPLDPAALAAAYEEAAKVYCKKPGDFRLVLTCSLPGNGLTNKPVAGDDYRKIRRPTQFFAIKPADG